MTQYINRILGEKNRITSMQKKQFDKNLTTFQQTTNNKLYQDQHKKCHYEKSTAMGKE